MRFSLLLCLVLMVVVTNAIAAPVMTPFKPDRDGFRFVNAFANNAVPELNIRTGGLCGGMSYAALDYYYKKMPLPVQDYRPAPNSTLQQYIYARQVDSIATNYDRWAEYGFNPDGIRNVEFFNWGLMSARIAELRSFIDHGIPVVLGLQGAGSGSHQVVAVGYDLGRYKADLGAYKEDFKIFIYDPNNPGKTMTLIPRLSDFTYTLAENQNESWRSYFVDGKYGTRTPPAITNPSYPCDGKIRELRLQFYTGADDLRGGNDGIYATVKFKNGMMIPYPNLNLNSRWLNNNEETVSVILPQPVSEADLDSLFLYSTFNGGIDGDNWDMAKLEVRGFGGCFDKIIKREGYHRFSGRTQVIVPIPAAPLTPAGFANSLYLHFKSGANGLPGGNNNINITVYTRSGTFTFNNVNGTAAWPATWNHYEWLPLPKNVKPADILQVVVSTTFGTGFDGANWVMESLEIFARGDSVNTKIANQGLKHFGGSQQRLVINTKPM